ncbi:hypothetical protein Pstr01_26020 [Pseudomonas straminea]|nr:hypothetical protein Pstr01_26020 [Pseudomonas straminea]
MRLAGDAMIGGAIELGTERDSGMALSLVQTVCAIIEPQFDNRKMRGRLQAAANQDV